MMAYQLNEQNAAMPEATVRWLELRVQKEDLLHKHY